MLRLAFWLGLPALLLVAVPLRADDKKADSAEKPPAKEKPPTVTAKFLAKVLSVNTKKLTLKVEIDEPIVTINRYHLGRIAAWQVNLTKALGDKNPKSRARKVADAENHIAYHQARLYERHDRHQHLDVQAADKVVVRTLAKPQFFDDKGKPRNPTPDELKAAKGDSRDAGYAAEFGDIKPGQIVELTVGKGKNVKPPSQSDESLDANKNKIDNKGKDSKPAESKPLIVRIVIAR
jgi:hypothetical protein